eukprot:359139-Chlamydomonas_euryale.AAC.3
MAPKCMWLCTCCNFWCHSHSFFCASYSFECHMAHGCGTWHQKLQQTEIELWPLQQKLQHVQKQLHNKCSCCSHRLLLLQDTSELQHWLQLLVAQQQFKSCYCPPRPARLPERPCTNVAACEAAGQAALATAAVKEAWAQILLQIVEWRSCLCHRPTKHGTQSTWCRSRQEFTISYSLDLLTALLNGIVAMFAIFSSLQHGASAAASKCHKAAISCLKRCREQSRRCEQVFNAMWLASVHRQVKVDLPSVVVGECAGLASSRRLLGRVRQPNAAVPSPRRADDRCARPVYAATARRLQLACGVGAVLQRYLDRCHAEATATPRGSLVKMFPSIAALPMGRNCGTNQLEGIAAELDAAHELCMLTEAQ